MVESLHAKANEGPCLARYLTAQERLADISIEFSAAGVFRPWFPASWFDSQDHQFKVMWCGSATRGWYNSGEIHSTEGYLSGNRGEIARSAFWRPMRRVGGHLDRAKELESASEAMIYDPSIKYARDHQPNSVVWNNLFRVGDLNGEPSKRLAESQLDKCIECLRIEIEASQPDVVMFHVGQLSAKFTKNYFGKHGDQAEDLHSRAGGTVGRYPHSPVPGVPHFWMTRKPRKDDEIVRDALAAITTAKAMMADS